MINWFKGHAAAKEKEFVTHINKKKDKCNEGGNVIVDHLMTLALNKCTNWKRSGEWSAPADEERQIITLKASLEEVKKESLHLLKRLKEKKGKGKNKGGKAKGDNKGNKLKGKKKN